MHYYSEYKVEYWVKDRDGALLQRFNGDALVDARETATNALGHVYEVQLDVTMEGTFVVSEVEV